MATDTRQSTCSLSLGQIVPGAPHYLGVVNYIHPITSQVSKAECLTRLSYWTMGFICLIMIYLLFIFIIYMILNVVHHVIFIPVFLSSLQAAVSLLLCGEEVVHKETVCGWRPSFSTNFGWILRPEGHHHRCLSDSSLCDDERRKVCIFGWNTLIY